MADSSIESDEQLRTADEALTNNKYEKASLIYSSFIESTNGHCIDVGIYLKRCKCYYHLEQFEKALQDAKLYYEKNDRSVDACLWVGKCSSRLYMFNEAYKVLRKGVELEPTNADIADELRSLQDAIMAVYESDDKETSKTYNAVDLCSQEPYPGDGELEVLEKDIMTNWKLDKYPDIKLEDLNQVKSVEELALAIEAKKSKEFKSALKHINISASYNPGNVLTWEERADVLFQMGDNKEAFRSCNAVPLQNRSPALWTLGGKILDALKLPVMAEAWLRIATKLSKGTESDAPTLFQQVRVKRLYSHLTAKSKATVTFTQYGRAVVCKEGVSKDCIIMKDKPTICAQTIDTQHIPACGHCALSLIKPEDIMGTTYLTSNQIKKLVQKHWPKRQIVPCDKCKRQIYCSVSCKDEAWERYHCIICPEVNGKVKKLYQVCDKYQNLKSGDSRVWQGWWNASFSPLILARIWASIVCNAKRSAVEGGRQTPSLSDWVQAKAPFRRFIAYGAQSNADAIPKMFDLMVDIFKDLGDGLCYNVTKREFDGRYYQATCNVQAFSDLKNPLRQFLENIKDKPNTRGVMEYIPTDPQEAEFAGMFALHACLNHSCCNNAEVYDGVVDDKPGVSVKARRNVEEGEEIFITYINTKMPRQQRRAWLYRAYNFWCHCERCCFEGDGAHVCTECNRSAGDKPFPTCSKCKSAWYCSSACQKLAWKKGHKKICSMSHSNTASSSDQYIARLGGK